MRLCLTTLVLAVLTIVHAAPSPTRTSSRRALRPRDDASSSSSGITVQIWAPLVAITIVVLVMIGFSCLKRRQSSAVTSLTNRANGSTHELTADQLSGGAAATTASSRRHQRQRRTPSQISTRSLPVYMEDPGDSELVLARNIREMDDPMPTLSEDAPDQDASNSMGSLRDFNASNTSQTPLIRAELSPPAHRASFDTLRMGSEDSHRALLDLPPGHSRQPSAEELRAMGDAPPYFEVAGEADIAQDGMSLRGMVTPVAESSTAAVVSQTEAPATPTPAASTSWPPLPGEHSARRSGFRSFAARLSQLMPSTSSAPSTSTIPAPFVPPVPSSPTVPPRRTTTISTSSSGSALTPSSSRISHILPRTRSMRSMRTPSTTNVNLTSPSTSSLGPISAPLPHTLVRTEFAYPKNGPTTEQMKFISSRETVGRFGVPYGVAAQAQAQALASRETLPPPFESPTVEAGPSVTRAPGESGVEGDSESGQEGPSADSSSPEPTTTVSLADAAPPTPTAGPKRPDTLPSRSSTRESVATFQTALEGLSSEHGASRSATPTPTPMPTPASLSVDDHATATRSAPTPPPTPPGPSQPR